MLGEIRHEVRPQELVAPAGKLSDLQARPALGAASQRLLETYAGLAQRRAHLFGDLLGNAIPGQWRHYPEDDAIDPVSGFQWFYHSHAPDGRERNGEHGHIHLFARRRLWSRRLGSARERAFGILSRDVPAFHNTRHLLAIGFDAKGVPGSMFTVNSWVTGDRMLSAGLTAQLLDGLHLDTGYPHVDAVIQSLVALHRAEIRALLWHRDKTLSAWERTDVLSDQDLEVLSAIRIDVDAKLAAAA